MPRSLPCGLGARFLTRDARPQSYRCVGNLGAAHGTGRLRRAEADTRTGAAVAGLQGAQPYPRLAAADVEPWPAEEQLHCAGVGVDAVREHDVEDGVARV